MDSSLFREQSQRYLTHLKSSHCYSLGRLQTMTWSSRCVYCNTQRSRNWILYIIALKKQVVIMPIQLSQHGLPLQWVCCQNVDTIKIFAKKEFLVLFPESEPWHNVISENCNRILFSSEAKTQNFLVGLWGKLQPYPSPPQT